VEFTGVITRKYGVPPVRVTPVIPVIDTKVQQLPSDVVVVREVQRAFVTCVPGALLTSVKIATSNVAGGGIVELTATSIWVNDSVPLMENRLAAFVEDPAMPDPFTVSPKLGLYVGFVDPKSLYSVAAFAVTLNASAASSID
jgi:hypothetical protein